MGFGFSGGPVVSYRIETVHGPVMGLLPELQRATLNLREQQGYTLSDICNILEVSESNVRVLLHRVRNRLFRCIEHFQESGGCCTD